MTVKEIAEIAGVSIGTVDRVLHGRGRVSEATKKKIQAIIERSGFTPNPIARRLKRSKPYRLFALLPDAMEDSGYWGQAAGGIAGAADEIAVFGVETVICEFDRYDPESFHSAAAKVLNGTPDGVLLAPVMPEEARKFVATIGSAVPYAFFDADLPGTEPLCAIGQDSFRGGYLAGKLARLFSGNDFTQVKKPFAILDAHAEDFHIRTRRDGFTTYAKEAGFSTITREKVDLEHDSVVSELLKSLLAEEPELGGVFVTSASSHRIAEAARKLRAQRRFVIIGYDLVPDNERMLRDGGIDAIISQRPETQGRRGLLDLYRFIVLGRSVEKRVDVPIDLYIKENLPPTSAQDAVEEDSDHGPKGV